MERDDYRRGRDANLAGRPDRIAETPDFRRGWQDAQDDRRLDDDEEDHPHA